MIFVPFGKGQSLEPLTIFQQSREKISQPAFGKNLLVSSGPDAEFFAVIRHNNDIFTVVGGEFSQMINSCLRILEWNGIAQSLTDWENTEGLALFLSQKMASQFAFLFTIA